MKLDSVTQIQILQNRIEILRSRGEEDHKNLINKAKRQIRKLQNQGGQQ